MGFAEQLLQRLGQEALPLDFMLPACSCIRAFTSADDERPTASKAFLHARLLAKTHGALKVLLAALRRVGAERPEICAALLATVQKVRGAGRHVQRLLLNDAARRPIVQHQQPATAPYIPTIPPPPTQARMPARPPCRWLPTTRSAASSLTTAAC
jgi:hypothetical protein